MKVVGYVRVSTQGQVGEDKFGIDDQKDMIREYAKRHGLHISKWYEDKGVSGATLDRDALQQLLTDAPKIDKVLVAKMDRVARDMFAQLWIEKELAKHETELISVSEPFHGTDPTSVLMRQIIGAFAQFERERIKQRTAGGRRQKAKNGGYSGGKNPLGYKVKDHKLVIDPKKAEAVRRIFQLRVDGLTLQAIADRLNEEGHTTAENRPFTRVQVKRVLDREAFYRGEYTYSGIRTKGKHQPIL